MTFIKLISSLFAILLLNSVTAISADFSTLYLIDAHSQIGNEQVLKKIIPLMDQAGVRRTILSGRSKLTSSDIASFAEQHPDRITASVRTKGSAYIENRSGYHKSLKRDVNSGRFGAIAELLMYHARKGKKASEIIVYPDDQRVQATLGMAKKKGWPLVLHIEFESLSGNQKTRFMEKLEALLTRNPKHPFIMIHMGQLRLKEVRRLIQSHKNVYFMTSHTNPVAVSKSKQPWTPMFKGDVLAPEWKELVIKHPNKFVLAFDNVWPDHWGEFYLQEVQYWWKAFSALPSKVSHAVAHGNAERLWKIPAK